MAKASPATALAKLVQDLQDQRQEYLDAIDEIDATFDSLGIKPGKATRRRGRKKAVRKKKGRKRFNKTAEEFVTGLLKKTKTMTTGQVNRRWAQSGRGGNADNTLSNLTRKKKVKRKNIKGAMGSEYQLAA